MPDPKSTKTQDTAVFTGKTANLTDAHLKELQDKFGLQLHVKSSADSVSKALGKLGEAAVQNFDRTNPGYERTFDRTGESGLEHQAVIDPVELENKVRTIATKVVSERGGKK
jgi:hypothetical protein